MVQLITDPSLSQPRSLPRWSDHLTICQNYVKPEICQEKSSPPAGTGLQPSPPLGIRFLGGNSSFLASMISIVGRQEEGTSVSGISAFLPAPVKKPFESRSHPLGTGKRSEAFERTQLLGHFWRLQVIGPLSLELQRRQGRPGPALSPQF